MPPLPSQPAQDAPSLSDDECSVLLDYLSALLVVVCPSFVVVATETETAAASASAAQVIAQFCLPQNKALDCGFLVLEVVCLVAPVHLLETGRGLFAFSRFCVFPLPICLLSFAVLVSVGGIEL